MFLTGSQELLQPQEAERHPHDARLVQVGADFARQRQRAGEFVEHLRFLTAPTSSRVPGAELPLLRAAPAGGDRQKPISAF